MKKNRMYALVLAGVTAAGTLFGTAAPLVHADSPTTSTTMTTFGNTDGTTDSTGTVDILCDSTGGSWTDSDSTTHPNGTYVVKIPTQIAFTKNSLWKPLNESKTYTVNVSGAIDNRYKVNLSASNVKDASSPITVGVTQEKTQWSADECFGTRSDGLCSGTDANDTVNVSGKLVRLGAVHATVTYKASMVAAN